MSGGLVTAAYIVAAILFIFSLAGLSKHETSRQGNNFGIAGMAIALLATIFGPDTGNVAWILVAMIIGGAIGIRMAKKVEMTEMPELVAILHSFVGLAAVLVGFNSYLYHDASLAPVLVNIHLTEVFLGIFIGAVTFTGSIVAFGKLRGKISSKPLMLPNRHKMNLAALVVSFLLLLVFVRTESVGLQVLALLLMTIIALAFGWHLVASIGGADMPVVVSMLNSYSGWAAAAAGFMLSNDLLIVTGALVGSSGAITLSYIFLSFAVKKIALGVAYALWEGIGILFITIFSVLLFDEALSTMKIAGLLTLVAGIVLIKSGTRKPGKPVKEATRATI